MSNKTKKYKSLSRRLTFRIILVVLAVMLLMGWAMRELNKTAVKDMAGAHYHVLIDVTNKLIENDLQHMSEVLEGDSANEARKQSVKWLRQWLQQQDIKINKRDLVRSKDQWDDKNLSENRNLWVYSVVVDREGNFVSHPDSLRMLNDNFFLHLSENNDSLSLHVIDDIKNGARGESKAIVDGREVYIYYDPLRHTDWTMAIIVPRRIEHVLISTWTYLQSAFILLALLCIYLVCYFAIRRTTKPLHALAKSAEEVAKGRFDVPLPKTRHRDEIALLRDSFENMQQSLGTYVEQLQTTTAEKAAMERDLHIAQRIQMALLPPSCLQQDGIETYAMLTPAKTVGGDLYDFFIRDGKLFFCIGDVTGKGVPAALLMTVSKSLFRAYSSTEDKAEQIVTQMNLRMSENNQVGLFVTMFVGVLDLASGTMDYCSAGHLPPVVISGDEASFLSFVPALPIGCLSETAYQSQQHTLLPGDTLFLYTDGLNEAKNAAKHIFGKKRIMDVVQQAMTSQQREPKPLIQLMTQSLSEFVGSVEQSDDLTMLAVMREK